MKLAQKSPLLRMPASAGTQGVPVCLLLAVVLTLVVELFHHKAFTSGRTRFLEFVGKASGRCCQCGNGTDYVVSGAVSAPAGILGAH